MRYTPHFEFKRFGTLWRSSRKDRRKYHEDLKYFLKNPSPDFTVLSDDSERDPLCVGGYVMWHGSEEWLVLWWPVNWFYLAAEGLAHAGIGAWWVIRNLPRML